ncbi:unnamed protein product [Trichobilharzia regenti]|nr:unnamed protein product [Trichobilharzia regenti]
MVTSIGIQDNTDSVVIGTHRLDVPAIRKIMRNMGYRPEDVREALIKQSFNNVTAIYLLLADPKTRLTLPASSFISSSPSQSIAGNTLLNNNNNNNNNNTNHRHQSSEIVEDKTTSSSVVKSFTDKTNGVESSNNSNNNNSKSNQNGSLHQSKSELILDYCMILLLHVPSFYWIFCTHTHTMCEVLPRVF